MLELRPVCEHCHLTLPPDSLEAMICSFECTFCRICAKELLGDICPNCGGGFSPRPIRPAKNWKGSNCLSQYPASTIKKHRPVHLDSHKDLVTRIGSLPPDMR